MLTDSLNALVVEALQDFTAKKNSKIPVLSTIHNLGSVSNAQPALITTTDKIKYLIAADLNFHCGQSSKGKSIRSIKIFHLSWARTKFF